MAQRICRAAEFRDLLERRALIADGAMGTMLYSKGVFINRCFDELNLSNPGMVGEIHREYVRSGAEILETNTFGANRLKLASFGLADKTAEINRAGVWIAREAAQERSDVFVGGAVGPLGVLLEPLGPTSFAEARAAYREQIEALVEQGVDLLFSRPSCMSTSCEKRSWQRVKSPGATRSWSRK
jgi:homocysteine S-methyltransferase